MDKDMKLRKFIATTIREYLNEQQVSKEEEAIHKALEGTNLIYAFESAIIKKNNEPLIKAIDKLLKPNNNTSSIAKNLIDVYMSMKTVDGYKLYVDPAHINLGNCVFFAEDLSTLLTRNGIKNEVQNPYNDWHVWVYSQGKYYDSEAINGVKNVEDLPLLSKK